MSKLEIDKIKNNLAHQLKFYIYIIKEEYKDFIPKEKMEYLNSINNFNSIILIEKTRTISMFVRDNKIYFPKSAFNILNKMKLIPGFGINKKHKPYNNENLLANDNTFRDYIKHVFIAGLNVENFYLETLLHETMHFCGISGASAIAEGITELKTRELAQKYNLETSGCGYPKEIKIALELQEIFGTNIINSIAFAKNNYDITTILKNNIGQHAVDLYMTINSLMEKEFHLNYYKYKYPGITGPIKKARKYSKLDYSEIYFILDNYKKKYLETKKVTDKIKNLKETEKQKEFLEKFKANLLAIDNEQHNKNKILK